MKGAICKKLRKVARTLPEIPIRRLITERTFAKDLPLDAKDEKGNLIHGENGKTEDPERIYKRKRLIETTVDHYERLKKVYLKEGNEGVVRYSGAITRYHAFLIRKQQELERSPDKQEAAQKNNLVV